MAYYPADSCAISTSAFLLMRDRLTTLLTKCNTNTNGPPILFQENDQSSTIILIGQENNMHKFGWRGINVIIATFHTLMLHVTFNYHRLIGVCVKPSQTLCKPLWNPYCILKAYD